ncbi:VOC family protein [Rathayibacter sp. YIM 133350]|uniref:VOC family protein n=1 Tax=Rathayibacter sp. YIM 133350 TaxID=3131992 RepID=UPI00307F0B19
MRVKMCSIHVDDPAAAFAVYTETLGFEPLIELPEHMLYVVRSPEDRDGVGLLLEPSDNPLAQAYKEGLYSSEIPVIVFGVPDVQAEYARLRAAGIEFRGEPVNTEWGTSAIFDDGCGNLVQLHQD